MDINDLIYAGANRDEVKEKFKTLFPDAILEDDNECDLLHEGRFSFDLKGYNGEWVDYFMVLIENGLVRLSLGFGVKSRTDKELVEDLNKRLLERIVEKAKDNGCVKTGVLE